MTRLRISRRRAQGLTYWPLIMLTVLLLVCAAAAVFAAPARGDWSGGHDVMGSEGASRTWFFAEGCSRDGFDTWLCLQNPTGEQAVCDIHYYCGDGAVEARPGVDPGAPLPRDHPRARARPGPGTPQQSPWRLLHRRLLDQRRAHRGRAPHVLPLQRGLAGRPRRDGRRSAPQEWYFAEGLHPPRLRHLALPAEPEREQASCDIDYYCGDGATGQGRRPLEPAHSRVTIPVHDTALGIGRSRLAAATCRSPQLDQRRPHRGRASHVLPLQREPGRAGTT